MKKNNSLGNKLTEKVPIKHFLLIMRTIFILLFTCIFCSMAEIGYTQNARVTINKRNVTLKEVLNEIESQTDYLFIYDNEVNTNEKVSVKSKQQAVANVLNALLKGKDVDYSMEGNHIILSAIEGASSSEKGTAAIVVQQQKKTITGRVTDAGGLPVIGANIVEKGTQNGTVTDVDGKFSLQVENNATIHISYIGYLEQSIAIAGQSVFNVTLLEDTKTLDEVVVVGYTTQKKELLTSAAVTEKVSEAMKELPVNSAANLLAGKMAGVFVNTPAGKPGTQASVSIRTSSSWNSQPVLYVIDGMIYNGSSNTSGQQAFQNLSAGEIESVTVLKDAAAAAVYGARAAGGVLVVTTKRGASGKPTINFTTNFSSDYRQGEVKLTNLYQFGMLVNQGYANIGQTAPAGRAWSQEELDWAKALPNQGFNALDAIWRTPYTTNNSLTVQGGSDKVKYFAAANYFTQGGFMKSTDYNRANVRLNVTADITTNLQLYAGFSMSIAYTTSAPNEGTDETYRKLREYFGYIPMYSDQGDRYIGNGWWPYGNAAMMADGVQGYQRTNFQDPQGTISLTYKLPWVQGLSVKASYAGDWSSTRYKQYDAKATYWNPVFSGANNHIVNADNNILSDQRVTTNIARLYGTGSWGYNKQTNLQASYDRSFGQHSVNAALVYEKSVWGQSSIRAEAKGFPVYQTDQWWATNRDAANASSGGGPDIESGRASFVGQVNYAYAGKYLATFSVRQDGSMNFAPSQRWGTFPAGSVGWILSKEKFLQGNKTITNLKLRASAGITGNDAVGGWQWQQSYTSGSTFYFGSSAPSPSVGVRYGALVNPDITWEKSASYNFGIDYELIRHLTGSIDYWYTHTYDILGNRQNSLPTTFSLTMPAENYGIVDAQGFDLSVGWKQKSGQVDWYANLVGSYGWNKVIKRDYAASTLPVLIPVGKASNYITGFESKIIRSQGELDAFKKDNPTYINPGWGSDILRLGSVVYEDISGPDGTKDGIINDYDRKILYANPSPVNYGLSLGAEWKGFSIDAVFNGVINKPANFSAIGDYNIGSIVMMPTAWIDQSWTPTNTNAVLPMFVPDGFKSYSISDASIWYQDASFMRLKNLNIAYTHNFKKPLGNAIQGFRVFVSGTNLFTISKFKWWDPELAGIGWSGTAYPIMRTISGGVNIKF